MPYEINREAFANKEAITARCREILISTPDGQTISDHYYPFLFELFRHHDEWERKAGAGVREITTQTTIHGTRCFVLVRMDNSTIDISFPHAVKLIPSSRSKNRQPQGLLDYRAAARTTISDQIRAFRDKSLASALVCPIAGIALIRDNSAVDHTPPNTFDQLLYNFTVSRCLNPLTIKVDSVDGTVATFENLELTADWADYHKIHATLRLISRIANLQLASPKLDWHIVCGHS